MALSLASQDFDAASLPEPWNQVRDFFVVLGGLAGRSHEVAQEDATFLTNSTIESLLLLLADHLPENQKQSLVSQIQSEPNPSLQSQHLIKVVQSAPLTRDQFIEVLGKSLKLVIKTYQEETAYTPTQADAAVMQEFMKNLIVPELE